MVPSEVIINGKDVNPEHETQASARLVAEEVSISGKAVCPVQLPQVRSNVWPELVSISGKAVSPEQALHAPVKSETRAVLIKESMQAVRE